ncbi:MAG: hypothetical protein NTW19_20605 [Planctomycetota bacterium]|nr:hypothetical protein [Planctomycetota bacterium]
MSLPANAKAPAAGRDAWWAVLLWLACLGALCTLPMLRHGGRPVAADQYRFVADAWWQGRDLPGVDVGGLPCLPQLAVLFSPFNFAPGRLGPALWRGASGLVLVGAIFRLARCGSGGNSGGGAWPRVFFAASALVLPALTPALIEGSAIVVVAALLGHAAADMAQRRWARAAALLALAASLAPAAAAVCLLAALLHPRQMSWRVGVALLVAIVLPFIAQPMIAQLKPDYVLRQYDLAIHDLGLVLSDRAGPPLDLPGLLRAVGVTMTDHAYIPIRLVAAACIAAAAWLALWRWGPERGWALALGLAVLLVTLTNPGAHGLDYFPLVPAWAILAASAGLRDGRAIVALALALVTLSVSLTAWTALHWIGPAAAVLLFLGALLLLVRRPAAAMD